MTTQAIALCVFWGNDEVVGRLSLTQREWNHICRGGKLTRYGEAAYGASDFDVCWRFVNGEVELSGDDGMEYWGGSIDSLMPRNDLTGADEKVLAPGSVPEDPPEPSSVFTGKRVQKSHQPAALAALRRIATPAAQPATTSDAAREPQTFTVDGATATLTPGEGRAAPTLRIESLALRVRILREIGCFEDEVVDYEQKHTRGDAAGSKAST